MDTAEVLGLTDAENDADVVVPVVVAVVVVVVVAAAPVAAGRAVPELLEPKV